MTSQNNGLSADKHHPQYVSDEPSGKDELQIDGDAIALADIISSRLTSPPLSIGIFGQEGSGKSFLAHLVSEKIRQLSQKTALARQNQQDTSYCSNIIQIRYNAWHNAGTNPWIGLVETIFADIDKWAQESKFNQDVFRSIGTARKMEWEYESKIGQAHALVEQAKSSLAEAEKQFLDAINRSAVATSTNKWTAVSEKLGEDWKKNKERDHAGQNLGIDFISQNPEQHARVLEESKTLSGQAGLISNSLKTRNFIGNFLLFIIAIAFFSLGSYILTRLYASSDTLKDWLELIKNILAVITGVATLIGALGGLYIRNQAAKAISTLKKDAAKLGEVIRATDQTIAIEAALAQQKVAVWQKIVENRQTRLSESENGYTLAWEDLRSFKKDNILRRIGDYYRTQILSNVEELQPGFVPIIREDFSHLSEIMSTIDHERGTPEKRENYPIERIVIFIDDLDQCLPQTAIAVIQAAHLLLSFPLFAVVFVVNPLWLLRALQPRYTAMEIDGAQGLRTGQKSHNEIDYLSKLIQIPLWVRPIELSAMEHFVRFMAGPEGDEPAPAPLPPDEIRPIASETPPSIETEAPAVELPTVSLKMTPAEIDFINRMAGFIAQSPRHVKQLINGYQVIRIIQYRRGLYDLTGSANLPPEFPAVLAQLAILIAAPFAALHYFKNLEATSSNLHPCTLSKLLDKLASDQDILESGDWPMIKAILETLTSATKDAQIVNDLLKWSMEVKLHSYNIPPTVWK